MDIGRDATEALNTASIRPHSQRTLTAMLQCFCMRQPHLISGSHAMTVLTTEFYLYNYLSVTVSNNISWVLFLCQAPCKHLTYLI